MKFEVYYVERIVKKITIDAKDKTDAGRSVILGRNDIDYRKSECVDSTIWSIKKVVEVKQ